MTGQSSSLPEPFARTLAQRGFTLVELAIALFVIGLLLAGALIPLSTQMEVRSIADTRRIMDQINEALIGFAQSNGRLPCPANATLQTGVGTAGTEQYTSPSCTAQLGVIPWSTLGVPETDAWGRRFTYRVASVFSDAISANSWNTTSPEAQTGVVNCTAPSPKPTQSSAALCSLGEMAVLNRSIDAAGVHSTSILGSGLPAVFVSHGKNGYGGYQTSGVQITGITANTDEAYNVAGGTPTGCPSNPSGTCTGSSYFTSYLFYSRNPTPYNSPCSETATSSLLCEYDDIVYLISAPMLMSRMISAGRLP